MDGQIEEQLAKDGQRQSLKKLNKKKRKHEIHFRPLPLSFSSLEQQARRQMEETDRRRICQEQSLKTVYDQMPSFSFPPLLYLHLFFSLHSIIPLLRYHDAAS